MVSLSCGPQPAAHLTEGVTSLSCAPHFEKRSRTMAAAPVVHFEIDGKDGKKLMEFYGELFEWKIDANNPMNYGMVDNGGNGINGGIGTSQNGQPWCGFYVSVPDCQA